MKELKKDITKLAIPAMIAGLAEPLVALADSAIVGKIDHYSLSAVNISGLFLMVCIWLISPISGAITSIISKAIANNQLESERSTVNTGLFITLIIGCLIALLSIFFSSEIFIGVFKAKERILEQAIKYYTIMGYSIIPILGLYYIFSVMRGHNLTFPSMMITIIGSLANILLNYLLVFGKFGVPKLGIEGAAYGSLLSTLIMLITALYYYRVKLDYKFELPKLFSPQVKSLVSLSSNLFIRTALLNLVIVYSNRLATKMNPESIAAHSIAVNLWMFSAYFIDGYAQAIMALGAKQKNKKDLHYLLKLSINRAIIICLICIGVFIVIYPYTGDIFNNNSKVLSWYGQIFLLMLLSQPFNAVAFIFDGLFLGLGKMQILRNTMAISTFFFFLSYLLFLLFFGFNLIHLWICLVIWMIFRALTLTLVYKKSYL